jgi:hypothetical protein
MGRRKIDPTKPIKDFRHFKVTAVYRKPDDQQGPIVVEESYLWKTQWQLALEKILGNKSSSENQLADNELPK